MGNERLIRYLLRFGGVYLIFEFLLHLSNLRLTDVSSLWPASALEYSKLMEHVYASFVLLAALIVFEIQKDIKKYWKIVVLTAIWSLFHAGLLIYSFLAVNFVQVFNQNPSLHVWSHLYNLYLLLEAGLLISYSVVVFLGRQNEKKSV